MKNDLSCAVVRDLLPSYVEGLTEKETNEAVERHLEGCPRCRGRYDAMRLDASAKAAEEKAKAEAEAAETKAREEAKIEYFKTQQELLIQIRDRLDK